MGDGKLLDGNETSLEFRKYLNAIATDKIKEFADECLAESGDNLSRALQDIVNEMGTRLGFTVQPGLYRGKKGRIGNDGLWKSHDWSLVVETKTTSTYNIDLNVLAKYRDALIDKGEIEAKKSSILLVVGRDDTDGLEAQIRGSKHAWDIRLISIEALMKLIKIKEELVDDKKTFSRVSQILRPLEYTRLDNLIDIIFTTSDDMQRANEAEEEGAKTSPVKFNDECVERIQKHLEVRLKKQTRTLYDNKENDTAIVCAVSKNHGDNEKLKFWFAFHQHQQEALSEYKTAFVAFGCGSQSLIFIFTLKDFMAYTKNMIATNKGNRMYWHVKIEDKNGAYFLVEKGGEKIDITSRKI
jgi:hypothetical protein